MALGTAGTTAATTLTALTWPATIADVAAMNQLIKDDLTTGTPKAHISGIGGLSDYGILSVPNRGELRIYPGDVVAIDPNTGGVVLVTALAIAGTDWAFA